MARILGKHKVAVLGRHIGSADSIEEGDDFVAVLLEFEPAPDIDLPAGDLIVDYSAGSFETFDAEGKISFKTDIFGVLKNTSLAEAA